MKILKYISVLTLAICAYSAYAMFYTNEMGRTLEREAKNATLATVPDLRQRLNLLKNSKFAEAQAKAAMIENNILTPRFGAPPVRTTRAGKPEKPPKGREHNIAKIMRAIRAMTPTITGDLLAYIEADVNSGEADDLARLASNEAALTQYVTDMTRQFNAKNVNPADIDIIMQAMKNTKLTEVELADFRMDLETLSPKTVADIAKQPNLQRRVQAAQAAVMGHNLPTPPPGAAPLNIANLLARHSELKTAYDDLTEDEKAAVWERIKGEGDAENARKEMRNYIAGVKAAQQQAAMEAAAAAAAGNTPPAKPPKPAAQTAAAQQAAMQAAAAEAAAAAAAAAAGGAAPAAETVILTGNADAIEAQCTGKGAVAIIKLMKEAMAADAKRSTMAYAACALSADDIHEQQQESIVRMLTGMFSTLRIPGRNAAGDAIEEPINTSLTAEKAWMFFERIPA